MKGVKLIQTDQGTGDNTPRAYLNVLFFNERFEFVQENSTALRVSVAGDGTHTLELDGIKAPKNGYVYVYLSNENDDPVYFDNFIVQDDRGRIIEEDHYYPYGLKIAGISSVKLPDPNEGNIENKYLYNDKEIFDDADLNWYDYGFRNYDPQIARFTQLDPLTDYFPQLTNYQYASDDPIDNIDIDGLEGGLSTLAKPKVLEGVFIKALPKTASKVASKALPWLKIGVNSFKIAADVADKTRIASSNQDPFMKRQASLHEQSMFDLLEYWLSGIVSGSGSHQRIGIVFTGNVRETEK